MPSVTGIVVSYEPELERFKRVLQALAPQVKRLLVIDNSESEQGRRDSAACCGALASVHSPVDVRYEVMVANIGLGAAYNAGIALAVELGATHALFLDQDSIVAPGMVDALLQGLSPSVDTLALLGRSEPPVTVGPWYIDELSGRRSVVLRSKTFMVGYDRPPIAGDELIPAEPLDSLPMPTEMLISSGSLIPVSALTELGELDSGLFIDHIDTDWSLRVHHAGHWMAIVPGAGMTHRLGDRVLRIWWGRTRLLPVHSPLRLYYTFRNSLWLYVRPHSHWRWVLFDLKRLLAVTLIHTLADGPRWQRLQMIARGIRDGMRGWRYP